MGITFLFLVAPDEEVPLKHSAVMVTLQENLELTAEEGRERKAGLSWETGWHFIESEELTLVAVKMAAWSWTTCHHRSHSICQLAGPKLF